MKRERRGDLVQASAESAEVTMGGRLQRLNPLSAIKKRLAASEEARQERLEQLTHDVATKLLNGIAEKGWVSLFGSKKTGERVTEMYNAEFTSSEMPCLGVTVIRQFTDSWNNDAPLPSPRVNISIIEHGYISDGRFVSKNDYRSVSIGHSNNYPRDTGFYSRYAVGGNDEGEPDIHDKSKTKVIPYEDKVRFLEEILRTEVDVEKTEKRFGAPYTPGGVRHVEDTPSYETAHTYIGYWVRDIHDQLPELVGVVPEIQS